MPETLIELPSEPFSNTSFRPALLSKATFADVVIVADADTLSAIAVFVEPDNAIFISLETVTPFTFPVSSTAIFTSAFGASKDTSDTVPLTSISALALSAAASKDTLLTVPPSATAMFISDCGAASFTSPTLPLTSMSSFVRCAASSTDTFPRELPCETDTFASVSGDWNETPFTVPFTSSATFAPVCANAMPLTLAPCDTTMRAVFANMFRKLPAAFSSHVLSLIACTEMDLKVPLFSISAFGASTIRSIPG